ncbi:MAG: hypothetical protein R3E08_02190 [Thiotrichaceae bacterium]
MERCPLCHARLATDTSACPRCSADLSLPLQCLAHADDYCRQAMIALVVGQSVTEAQQFLAQAQLLKRDPLLELLENFIASHH